MSYFIGFIPARYDSSRFPGKPLVKINGKTMIQRVYEQALKSKLLNDVIVLTDNETIYYHVASFGNVEMTSSNCINGTDRILSIIDKYPDIDGFVNIQGDEPFINPQQIDDVCLGIQHGNDITTLKYKTGFMTTENDVKVVTNNKDKALYFSRSDIPFNLKDHYIHIGIYGFHKNVIPKLKQLENSIYNLESEKLEQLIWLANGIDIYAYTTNYKTLSIDTPEDLEKIDKIFKFRNEIL
jgi:3-deoxy-manno-octulosonate cytidylyltransferase (CMP-KDO synthetase)